jgi:beta-lactamase class D
MPTCVWLFTLSITTVLLAACSCSSPPKRTEGNRPFAAATVRAFESPANACLVLLEPRSGKTRVMNAERAQQRFSPASTFKVPNALIGLDTGVIPDTEHVIPWDGTRHDRDVNNHNHSLRSAMRYSVVWYFQELARRVGQSRMEVAIRSFNYGNADISSGLTTFWLRGSIRISADEQAAFLRRLQQGSLPVSHRAAAGVLDILTLARGADWTYRGKTGTYSGLVDGIHADLGWFVGWIEYRGRVLIFAANDSTEGTSGPAVRVRVEHVLVELGELPADWADHCTHVPIP